MRSAGSEFGRVGGPALLGSDKSLLGSGSLLDQERKQREEMRAQAKRDAPDIGIILKVNIGGTYDIQIEGGKTLSGVANLTRQGWLKDQWVTLEWTAGAPGIVGWGGQQMGAAVS